MLRNYLLTGLACACLLALASTALGHGFRIARSGNQIVALTQDPVVLYQDLFRHDIEQVSLTEYTANHGMIQRYTSGAPAPYASFDAADTFRFDIIGPLLYSNGFTVTNAPANVTMNAFHSQPPNQSIFFDGSSNNTSVGFPVNANTPSGFRVSATGGGASHHVQWTLESSPGTVPHGAYGVHYRISGYDDNDLSAPFDPTDVLIVFDTEFAPWGTAPLGQLSNAQLLLYEAFQAQLNSEAITAAPEPASGLMVLGALLGVSHLRAKRRKAVHGPRSA